MAPRNFDKFFFAVIIALAGVMGIDGLAPADAATLPAPGLQEPQDLGRFAPGESFLLPLIVPVGSTEVWLAGPHIEAPKDPRGFRTVRIEFVNGKKIRVLQSVTLKGVPTNGAYHLLTQAPMAPGRYEYEFRNCHPAKAGWRSNIWIEVVAKDGDGTGTDAQSESPQFGGTNAAPPIRVSTRLEGIRTLGQDPKSTSPDSLRGEIVAAMRIVPETDLRGKLIGNKSDPDPTASDYSWGQNAGAGIGIGRQVGEVYIAMDGEITPDLSFKEDDLWGKTPLVLLASAESTKWHYGWLKSEGFLALSTRHAGARGVGKLKIAGDGVNSHLAIALGGHGNKGWTTGAAYGQYLFGFETGLRTDLGYATIGALAGAGDGEPMSALGTLTIRN